MGITVNDICDLLIDNFCTIELYDVATNKTIFKGYSDELGELGDLEICTIDIPYQKELLTFNVDTEM